MHEPQDKFDIYARGASCFATPDSHERLDAVCECILRGLIYPAPFEVLGTLWHNHGDLKRERIRPLFLGKLLEKQAFASPATYSEPMRFQCLAIYGLKRVVRNVPRP